MDHAKLTMLEDTGGLHFGNLQQESCSQPISMIKDIGGLAAVRSRGVALAIWQRALPRGVQRWLDALPATTLPRERILVRPADFRHAVSELLAGSDVPTSAHREFLISDMDELVQAFATICNVVSVDARIEGVSDDACWKFHRDCVEMRLITTYRGPATEWVIPEHGEAALSKQRSFPGPIQRLTRGDVAIFKGTKIAGEDGIVHRSPPISGSGTTRLLLCLNAPSNASPRPWAPADHTNFPNTRATTDEPSGF